MDPTLSFFYLLIKVNAHPSIYKTTTNNNNGDGIHLVLTNKNPNLFRLTWVP